MSDAHFRLTYDGPALEQNEIDVRALGPALYAMGDLIEEAGKVVLGPDVKLVVKVKGSFKTGSFGIDLHVALSTWQSLVAALTKPDVQAAATLLSLLGLSASGVLFGVVQVLKKIRGRPIHRVIEVSDRVVRLEVDGDSIEIERAVLDLLRNRIVRKSIQEVIFTPLQTEGIAKVAIGDEKQFDMVVTADEASHFKAPMPEDEDLGQVEYEKALQIVGLSFKEDNKWRFADGNTTFFASIADTDFLTQVDKGQRSFTQGDVLRVSMLERQRMTPSGLKTDYTIVKVRGHLKAERQLRLEIEPAPPTDPIEPTDPTQ